MGHGGGDCDRKNHYARRASTSLQTGHAVSTFISCAFFQTTIGINKVRLSFPGLQKLFATCFVNNDKKGKNRNV